MKSLGAISFSYQQLVETADLNNGQLCKSLTKLVLEGVPYEAKWAELLIIMAPITSSHKDIINYFIGHDWLENKAVLEYLASLPEEIYELHFLKKFHKKFICSSNKIH